MIGVDKGRICWGCCALLSIYGVVSLLHPSVARFTAFCERLFDILFRNCGATQRYVRFNKRLIEWSEMSAKHECMELEQWHFRTKFI